MNNVIKKYSETSFFFFRKNYLKIVKRFKFFSAKACSEGLRLNQTGEMQVGKDIIYFVLWMRIMQVWTR